MLSPKAYLFILVLSFGCNHQALFCASGHERDIRGLALAAVLDRTLVVFEPQGRSRHHRGLKDNNRLCTAMDSHTPVKYG